MITPEGFVDARDTHDCMMDLFANVYYVFHPNDLIAEDAIFGLIEAAPRDENGNFQNKA